MERSKSKLEVLLRRAEVLKLADVSSATLYRMIRDGKFPRAVNLGTGSDRWRLRDVERWQKSLAKSEGIGRSASC